MSSANWAAEYSLIRVLESDGQAGAEPPQSADRPLDIVLCRDLMTTLSVVLKPQSLIVLGASRSRWRPFDWLDREYRLAQRLRSLGHQVVSADLN